MKAKKSPEVDLDNKKVLFFSMGLVIAFAVVLTSLELKQTLEVEEKAIVQEVVVEEEAIPITKPITQPPPPPPPPPPIVTDQIVIVEDDFEIEEEFDFSSEIDETTEITTHELADVYSDGEEEESGTIFLKVEKMPFYPPEGDKSLLAFISKNVSYPVIAQENGIQGRVIVGFVVDRDGSVTDVTVLRPVDPSLDKEAIRVVKKMGKWRPGEQAGKTVRVRYQVPVTFRLR